MGSDRSGIRRGILSREKGRSPCLCNLPSKILKRDELVEIRIICKKEGKKEKSGEFGKSRSFQN
jgi:hypothetical protein